MLFRCYADGMPMITPLIAFVNQTFSFDEFHQKIQYLLLIIVLLIPSCEIHSYADFMRRNVLCAAHRPTLFCREVSHTVLISIQSAKAKILTRYQIFGVLDGLRDLIVDEVVRGRKTDCDSN